MLRLFTPSLICIDLSPTRACCKRVGRTLFCYRTPNVYNTAHGELLKRAVPIATSPSELAEHAAIAHHGLFDQRDSDKESAWEPYPCEYSLWWRDRLVEELDVTRQLTWWGPLQELRGKRRM